MKVVIADLTSLINAQDYEGWRSYLTSAYIARTSDPKFLDVASHSGVLQKSGIVLRTLKDYFENVVVRSRVQASLTDINFLDETHVKALTIVDGRPGDSVLSRTGGRALEGGHMAEGSGLKERNRSTHERSL